MPYSPGIHGGILTGNLTITGNLVVQGNTTLGDSSADTLTINAGTWTYGANWTATRAAGTVAAGSVNLTANSYTASGDVGGTSNIRGNNSTFTLSGSNAVAGIALKNEALSHNGTGLVAQINFNYTTTTLTNTGNATNGAGIIHQLSLTSTGSLPGIFSNFEVRGVAGGGAGTVGTWNGLRVFNPNNANITTAVGVKIDDFTSASNMRGVQLSLSSGANKFNVYADGAAENYFAGNVGIGALPSVSGTSTLYVSRSATATAAGDQGVHVNFVANNASGANNKAGAFVQTNVGNAFAGTSAIINFWGQATRQTGTAAASSFVFLADCALTNASTVSNYGAFQSNTITNTGGAVVTNNTSFNALAQTVGTNIYGYRGQIAAASGRYNLYMDGTAQNYMAGELGIGVAASSTTQLVTAASTTGKSSLRLPHGAAPSAPVDGDMWTTTAGLFVRINGVTVGPLA